jgi:hypothetical protein
MSELYNTHDFTPIPETLSQETPETDESSPAWVHEDARNLLARDSDLEVVATIRRDSMDPAGTYVSDPDEYPLRASVEQFKGRISVTLSGIVTLVKPRDKNAKLPEHAVRTQLNFFRLSPDRRNKLVYGPDNKPTGEETNTPDAASLRWLEAREAYKAVTGEEAKQDIQVVDFLTEHPVYFVMFQGSRGLGVSKIYAKKA